MPVIEITTLATLPVADKQALAVQMTDLIADVLGKRREVTSVVVREAAAAVWTIGGGAVEVAAHAEIAITAGTNNAAEKAEMIRRTHAALQACVPGVHEATYVVVRELAAECWGYGGRTQADRFSPRSSPA